MKIDFFMFKLDLCIKLSIYRNIILIPAMNDLDISCSMIIEHEKKNKNNNNYIFNHPAGIRIGTWQPDPIAGKCTKCKGPFFVSSWLSICKTGIHHCRFCGKACCENCTKKTAKIPDDMIVQQNSTTKFKPYREVIYEFAAGKRTEEKTCDDCYILIQVYNRISDVIKYFNNCEFDILQLERIKLVCKDWCQAALEAQALFRYIQYKLPQQKCNESEEKSLWINLPYLSGHSKYLVQILRLCTNNQDVQRIKLALEEKKYQRTQTCITMMCTRNCKENFHHSDIVNVLMHYIDKCKLGVHIDQLADFVLEHFECDNEIIKCYIALFINVSQYDTRFHKIRNYLLRRFAGNIEMLAILYFEVLYYVRCEVSIKYYTSLLDLISKCVDPNPKKLNRLLRDSLDDFDMNESDDEDFDTSIDGSILNNTMAKIHYTIVPLFQNVKEGNIDGDMKFYNKNEMIDPLDTKKSIKTINLSKTVTFKSKTSPVKIPYTTFDGISKAMIFKREDVRQDQIAINIIRYIKYILAEKGINIDIVTYQILPISKENGLIEMAINSKTIENIAETEGDISHFLIQHNRDKVIDEVMNTFMCTTAAYCVVTYILGIGDRHLGNVMITHDGKLFNIDFGYIFGHEPLNRYVTGSGSTIRLTEGMINIFGGKDSENYKIFENLCVKIFSICRREISIILRLFSMLANIPNSNITQEEINVFVNERLQPGETDEEAKKNFLNMLAKSETFSQRLTDVLHTSKAVTNVKDSMINNVNYISDKLRSFVFSGSN